MLTALQQAIAELQAGRREDHVKMETQQERIEELQAENRAQNAKIEKLMESDRRAQTSILLRCQRRSFSLPLLLCICSGICLVICIRSALWSICL
jgi:hypothetical protein